MIIQDRDNSSGMFSKAGRLSIEMFSLLQEKDNILSNKKKTFQPRKASEITQNLVEQKTKLAGKLNKSENETNLKVPKKTNKLVLPTEKQPFTKIVSRDYLYELGDKYKINNQKFGMYHPKYHFIFEKSPFYEDQKFVSEQKENILNQQKKLFGKDSKQKIKKQKVISSKHNILKSNSAVQLEKLSQQNSLVHYKEFGTDIKGQVRFSRQGEKKSFFNSSNLNEKRFEYLELPRIYSKVHEPQNIYFKKAGKGRSMFALPTSGLQYDVNLDAIYPKSSKLVLKFDQRVPRKGFEKPIYTLDESICDTSMYKPPESNQSLNNSLLYRKISGPNFDNMLAREKVVLTNISMDQQEKSISIRSSSRI